jgi:hypothetical protein
MYIKEGNNMKTTKTPLKVNKSLAVIIPDWIVKAKDIKAESKLTIILTSYGFKVEVSSNFE